MPSRAGSGDGRLPKRKRESLKPHKDGVTIPCGLRSTKTTPVVRLEASGKSCQDEQRNLFSMMALDRLMAPLEGDIFLRDCFRHSAVYVSCPSRNSGDNNESAQRLSTLREELFDLDPELILNSTSSESVFVWLQSRNHLEDDLIQSIDVSDPTSALALYKAGHATYCRVPPALEQLLVSALLAETGLGCGQYDPSGESSTCLGRGEVEVFMGTEGHRTGWHWDFQENFTIQLSGSKKWTLQKGSVSHPLRGCTPHYRSPDSVEPQLKAARLGDSSFAFGHPTARPGAEPEEVVMKPGDVLYFPAGMWHKVEVLEPGISINVSLMAANYATVTCQALQHLLLQSSEWRESVVNNAATDAMTHLKTLLHKLPSIIEEFERDGGGAAAILPTAVRTPHLRDVGHDTHEESDLDDEDDEVDGMDPKDLVDVSCGDRSNSKPYRCTEQQLRQRFQSHKLVRNPLALLLKESEIFQFYKRDTTSEDLEAETREIFVLNVNYAGTESHESVVRVRILDTGRLLSHIYASVTTNRTDLLPKLEKWIGIESERTMLGCLVYYGFLVWVPRDDKAVVA